MLSGQQARSQFDVTGLCSSNTRREMNRYVANTHTLVSTYETIARRLSPQPDPQIYFTRKRQGEAKELGEFVDIHDIARGPRDYDVLITNINHETLETTIAEELVIPYLSVVTECQDKEVVQEGKGYIHWQKYKAIVPFISTSHLTMRTRG